MFESIRFVYYIIPGMSLRDIEMGVAFHEILKERYIPGGVLYVYVQQSRCVVKLYVIFSFSFFFWNSARLSFSNLNKFLLLISKT